MATTLTLHGGMFGLGVYRQRRFESNVAMLAPGSPWNGHGRGVVGIYGEKPDGRTPHMRWRNNGNYKGKSPIRVARSLDEGRAAMGINWMTWDELREAIPPAYTQFIGEQLLRAVEQVA